MRNVFSLIRRKHFEPHTFPSVDYFHLKTGKNIKLQMNQKCYSICFTKNFSTHRSKEYITLLQRGSNEIEMNNYKNKIIRQYHITLFPKILRRAHVKL